MNSNPKTAFASAIKQINVFFQRFTALKIKMSWIYNLNPDIFLKMFFIGLKVLLFIKIKFFRTGDINTDNTSVFILYRLINNYLQSFNQFWVWNRSNDSALSERKKLHNHNGWCSVEFI